MAESIRQQISNTHELVVALADALNDVIREVQSCRHGIRDDEGELTGETFTAAPPEFYQRAFPLFLNARELLANAVDAIEGIPADQELCQRIQLERSELAAKIERRKQGRCLEIPFESSEVISENPFLERTGGLAPLFAAVASPKCLYSCIEKSMHETVIAAVGRVFSGFSMASAIAARDAPCPESPQIPPQWTETWPKNANRIFNHPSPVVDTVYGMDIEDAKPFLESEYCALRALSDDEIGRILGISSDPATSEPQPSELTPDAFRFDGMILKWGERETVVTKEMASKILAKMWGRFGSHEWIQWTDLFDRVDKHALRNACSDVNDVIKMIGYTSHKISKLGERLRWKPTPDTIKKPPRRKASTKAIGKPKKALKANKKTQQKHK